MIKDSQIKGNPRQKEMDNKMESLEIKVLGPFQITKTLGAGAFKTVYQAVNMAPEKNGYPETVALCVPHTRDKETDQITWREYNMISNLDHPGIVKVFGLEKSGDCSFIVMEVVAGRNLKEMLMEDGPMGFRDAVDIIREAGEVLDYAHVLPAMHRDIKPANIVQQPNGRIKVLDFGLARLLEHSRYQGGTGVGTLDFMAPEQFDGAAGTRADLWSLGVTFFQLITGKKPFPGKNDAQVINKIIYSDPELEPLEEMGFDPRLIGVMRKILDKEPDKRYGKAAAFVADLEAVLRHAEVVNKVEGEIEVLLRSHFPLVFINTHEENRVLESFKRIRAAMSRERETALFIWKETVGMCDHEGRLVPGTLGDPLKALHMITESEQEGIFLFLDIHQHFTPVVIRMIRDAVWTVKRKRKSLVFISPVLSLPEELEPDTTLLFYDLPDMNDLRKRVTELAAENKHPIEDELRESLARAVLGLTYQEAGQVLKRAMIRRQGFDKGGVIEALGQKQQIVRKAGYLEYCKNTADFNQIGGLDLLKNWFWKRRQAYSADGIRFGLKPPKGVVLLGIPGCGKSLSAKALASEWNVPLLRMDLGKIRSGLLGASEANLRKALHTAESVSPCVLWIDELEKAFGGLDGALDSGVSQRIFGAFLTWLEEKTAPVFVVATANNISKLPPEFLRKGRFDETFFVDLPKGKEREEIFKVHISKRNQDTERFDLNDLVKKSLNYSGAEIEEAVISGLYDAFVDNERALSTRDILTSLQEIKPVATSREAEIARLRSWAANHARPAQV